MVTDRPRLWIMLMKMENATEGEWRKDITGDTFYPLQTPRSGHNAKTSAKAIRDEFQDYFITEGALERQWKYC